MAAEPDKTIRTVFIVDDHPLVREWLANLINRQADLKVCGGVSGAPEAMEQVGILKPDVGIVDISLEGVSGLDLIKRIRSSFPRVAVVVYSMHDETLYAERSIRAGARGYVMKRDVTSKILEAIRCVLDGKLYLSENAAAKMSAKLDGEAPGSLDFPIDSLSNRELEVFQLMGRGLSTRQVAGELDIGFTTVQAFYARIKKKLNLKSGTELLREAIRWNDSRP
jgi:DNA-binding NarL/FixJ family response regulator